MDREGAAAADPAGFSFSPLQKLPRINVIHYTLAQCKE
jgi:hypothetical protein